MFDSINPQHRAEFRRALANFHFEPFGDGNRVLFPRQKAVVAGAFRHRVNGGDERIDANVITFEALSDILRTYFAQQAQHTAYYILPFTEDVDPAQTLTAATFHATMGEFTNYTEATRQTWAKDAEASQSIGNGTTPARFTINTGGGTVRGAAMSTQQAKLANTGIIVPCARFADDRVLAAGDKLDIEYVIQASDPDAP